MADLPKIFPFILYDDAPAAIEWLCAAFGFEKQFIVPGEEPGTIAHAQLKLGPEVIMVGTARGAARGERRPAAAEARQGIYMYMPDIEAHYKRAKAQGGALINDVRDTEYGSREFGALDCEGPSWSFGTYSGEGG